jgi:DNA repair protein RecO (recombination protein O)
LSRQLTTKALLARKVITGESDLVCTLLCEQGGKLSAIARGARRSRRRFGAALSLFVVGRATLKEARGSELWSLEGFECLADLSPQIGSDLVAVAHGSYLIEVVRELLPTGQDDRQIFQHLVHGLEVLARGGPSPSLLRAFELQLLARIGCEPRLDACVVCGGDLDGEVFGFSVTQGGVICQRCGPHGWPLGLQSLQLLQQLQRKDLTLAHGVRPDPRLAHDARDLMLILLRHHLGKDLQCLHFLAQLPAR